MVAGFDERRESSLRFECETETTQPFSRFEVLPQTRVPEAGIPPESRASPAASTIPRTSPKLGQAEASWQSKVAKPNPPVTQLPTTPYLDRPRPRKIGDDYVGGTLIATNITNHEQHAGALANPELERPQRCAACDCPRIHVHERRTRLLDGRGSARVEILIFRCANAACRVVWRVLPAFLARHLWRAWARVVEALDEARERCSTPSRTRQRWLRRLRERATMLVAVLAQLGPREPVAVARLGLDTTRREVIVGFGLARLDELAALVDRLVPGVRVM